MLGRFLRRGPKPPTDAPDAAAATAPAAPAAPPTLPEALAIAVAHHQSGRLDEAAPIYAWILDSDPNHFDATHLLGVVALQRGDHARAAELIERAVSLDTSNAQARSNLGEAYRRLGRFAEAESSYRAAIARLPDYFEAHFNLGLLLQDRGALEQARDAFREAVRVRPQAAPAHASLAAVLHRLGDAAAARTSYQQALALQPDAADTHNNLGALLQDQGDWDGAAECYRRALGLRPDFAMGHLNFGSLLHRQGRREEARAAYQSALTLDPGLHGAHVQLGRLLSEEGRLSDALARFDDAARLTPQDEGVQLERGRLLHALGQYPAAREAFERALALAPASAEAAFGLGIVLVGQGEHAQAAGWFDKAVRADPDMAPARWAHAIAQLPAVYVSAGEMAERRAAFAQSLIELEAWLGTRAVPDGDRAVAAVQPFLLAYQNEPNRELLERCGRIAARLLADWRRARSAAPARPARGKRLRLGVASAQLRDHSVWNAIVRGWFAHLDSERVELHVFHLGTAADAETAYARSRATRMDQGPRTLEQWAGLIEDRALDALIYPEVGMDPMCARLAAMRLAPLQAASWGHPETTGLPTIDYYLSGADLEPPEAQANYSERLVQLPNLGCAVAPYRGPIEPADRLLGDIGSGAPLLVCPGTPMKYTPENDAPLIEIARALGRCKFLFFNYQLPSLSERLRGRLFASFAAAGLSPEQFVVFLPWQTRPAFYGLMQRADVYLDTVGFSGFNTALQALECGLPVVTREGRFLRGRLASGLLRRAGLGPLVAGSDASYVETAVRLARDKPESARLRARIAEARAALFDDLAPIRALEAFLVEACGR